MNYNLYALSDEEFEMLSSMEKITAKDVQPVFQRVSCGKIKNPAVGKLTIVNRFFPQLKSTILPTWEEKYVFYAVEKYKASLFSKPTYRIFIWIPYSTQMMAISPDAVTFAFEDESDNLVAKFLLFSDESRKDIYTTSYTDEKVHHTLTQIKQEIWREYDVTKDAFVCRQDSCHFMFEWSNPDDWVISPFVHTIKHQPMHYLRHTFDEDKAPYSHYPSKPFYRGGEIEE